MKSIKIASIVSLLAIMANPGLAQDAAKGKKVFNKCRACHMVGEDAKNRSGPILNGIVGNPAGQVQGFKYSGPMLEAAADGLVWDSANLAKFLAKPKNFIKGTKMMFSGLKKESDIANVLAYITSFE